MALLIPILGTENSEKVLATAAATAAAAFFLLE